LDQGQVESVPAVQHVHQCLVVERRVQAIPEPRGQCDSQEKCAIPQCWGHLIRVDYV
jgi:hypothetical protein